MEQPWPLRRGTGCFFSIALCAAPAHYLALEIDSPWASHPRRKPKRTWHGDGDLIPALAHAFSSLTPTQTYELPSDPPMGRVGLPHWGVEEDLHLEVVEGICRDACPLTPTTLLRERGR